MDKYEYLTCEDLGYKPGVVEQAKFESYSLGKTFDKGLKVDDKEDWHLKRIKKYWRQEWEATKKWLR